MFWFLTIKQSLDCCPTTAGRRKLIFKMNLDYFAWNCSQWIAQTRVLLPGVRICNHRPGSVEADLDLQDAAADDALNNVPAIPALMTITDPISGRVSTPPASDWWIWLLIALAVAIVVAVVIIVIVCCIRRRNDSKRDFYSTSSYVPIASSPVPTTPVGSAIACRVLQDVIDSGEGILQARAGQICFVEPADFAGTGDWCWVKLGTQHGYVPRLWLQKVV
jgi:hypothetical protein